MVPPPRSGPISGNTKSNGDYQQLMVGKGRLIGIDSWVVCADLDGSVMDSVHNNGDTDDNAHVYPCLRLAFRAACQRTLKCPSDIFLVNVVIYIGTR